MGKISFCLTMVCLHAEKWKIYLIATNKQVLLTFADIDYIGCDFCSKMWIPIQHFLNITTLYKDLSWLVEFLIKSDHRRATRQTQVHRVLFFHWKKKESRKQNRSKDERQYSLSRLLQMLQEAVRKPSYHVAGRNAPMPKMRSNEIAISRSKFDSFFF